MNIVLVVLVLYLFFLVVSHLSIFVKVLNIRLRPTLNVKANPEDMPDDLRQSLTESSEFFWKNGFKFDHCQRRNAIEVHDTRVKWYVAYRREETGTYAEVSVPSSPSAAYPVEVVFSNFYSDKTLSTVGAHSNLLIDRAGHLTFNQSETASYSNQLKMHQKAVQEFEKIRETSERLNQLTGNEYEKRINSDYQTYLSALTRSALVTEINGCYKPNISSAFKSVLNHIRRSFQPKLKQKCIDAQTVSADITTIEVEAYENRRETQLRLGFSAVHKLTILITSAIVSSIFMGHLISFELLLTLIPVLFLHELGHWCAMSVFGYRNKFMMFIPIGAFVKGDPNNAPTWQQMIVVLAGPIPGLILAGLLMVLFPEMNDWMWSFVLMLLFLNFINLLPMKPLDGGVMVDLAISCRFPVLKFSLHLFSTAIALISTWLFFDSVMVVLVIFLILMIKNRFSFMTFVRGYLKQNSNTVPSAYSSRSIFEFLSRSKDDFETKFHKSSELLEQLNRRPSNLAATTMAVGLYLATLASPIFIEPTGTIASLATVYLEKTDTEEWSDEYYSSYYFNQINSADTAEEKISALLEASYYNAYVCHDIMRGIAYAVEADELASSLGNDVVDQFNLSYRLIDLYARSNNLPELKVQLDRIDDLLLEEKMTALKAASIYLNLAKKPQIEYQNRIAYTNWVLTSEHNGLPNWPNQSAAELKSQLLYKSGASKAARTLAESIAADYAFDQPRDTSSAYLNLSMINLRDGIYREAYQNRFIAFEHDEYASDWYKSDQLAKYALLAGYYQKAREFIAQNDESNQNDDYYQNDDSSSDQVTSFVDQLLSSVVNSDSNIDDDSLSDIEPSLHLILAHADSDLAEAQRLLKLFNHYWEIENEADLQKTLADYFPDEQLLDVVDEHIRPLLSKAIDFAQSGKLVVQGQ